MRVARLLLACFTFTFSAGAHCSPRGEVDDHYEPWKLTCGDGRLHLGEQCDDGNVALGDGCDRCTVEAPSCEREVDGVVRWWRCDGAPSRCELRSCRSSGADADCPAELAVRQVSVTVKRAGFVAADDVAPARVDGAGIACSCTETAGGLACEPGCTASLATCVPHRLDATALASRFARWSGGCVGTEPGCTLRLDPAAWVEPVEGWFDAAPVNAGALSFDYPFEPEILGIDGPRGDLAIGARDDYNDCSVVLQVGRDGTVRRRIELGGRGLGSIASIVKYGEGDWSIVDDRGRGEPVRSDDGTRIASLVADPYESSTRGLTITVVDTAGTLLYRWVLPPRDGATLGLRLAGVDAAGGVVLVGFISGPYQLGPRLRFGRGSRRLVIWLSPSDVGVIAAPP